MAILNYQTSSPLQAIEGLVFLFVILQTYTMPLFYEQNLAYVFLGNGKQNFMAPRFFYSF